MKTLLSLLISLNKSRGRSPNSYGFRHFPTGLVGLHHACKIVLLGGALGLALHPSPVLPQDAGGGVVAALDTVGDGLSDGSDNCPIVPNPGQADTFGLLGGW